MGLFDRLYYGKAGKADYTAEDLPRNRFQLFFEVFRVRFWSLMRVNLMQVIFWIPFALWTYLNFVAIVSVDIAAADATAQLQGYLQMYLLGLLPCIAITGPSSAAAAYVTRNWARDQHSFVWSDFKDAFKDNWKQALLVSIITGAMPSVVYFGYTFYGAMAANNFFFLIPQALIFIVALLWTLMLPLLYPLMAGYEFKFRHLLHNGLLIALARLPHMIGIRLLTAIPMIILLVGMYFFFNIWILFGAVVYYVLMGLALSRLVYASVANGFFDKYINVKIEGAEINRGLYKDEFADDDDDEESDEDDDDEDEDDDEE